MATPSKAKLCAQLRELGAVPPADASAEELKALLRRVRALKTDPVAGQRAPRPPEHPRFADQPPVPQPPASTFASPAETLTATRTRRMTDHTARPWDPHAGW